MHYACAPCTLHPRASERALRCNSTDEGESNFLTATWGVLHSRHVKLVTLWHWKSRRNAGSANMCRRRRLSERLICMLTWQETDS